MSRRERREALKKKKLKFFYKCFIIFCFVMSIVCLFKNQEANKTKNEVLKSSYIIQYKEKNDLVEKLEKGEIDLTQNIPIPKEIQEKIQKEAEEKKKAEEEKKKQEEEARKKAEEEKKKQEAIKIAEQEKIKVTSRGNLTTRSTSETKAEYQAYAKNLCLNTYGWTENDFNCLIKLWDRESGWNPNAHNSSSDAHGIPQALPASKMSSEGSDYYTNGKTQIRWGLKYIKNRYGNPSNAWAHSQQKGWY